MFQLPRECRVYTKIEPKNQWGFRDVSINKMVFYLETLVWQNGYNPKQKAQHMAHRPKLFVPDFMRGADLNTDSEKHTTDDIDRMLAMKRIEPAKT